MRLRRSALALLALLPMLIAAGPKSCHAPARVYALTADADVQQGCFPPLACPVVFNGDIGGTFRLTPIGLDDATGDRLFAVNEVYWLARIGGEDVPITGYGAYTLGADTGPNAGLQRLTLKLTVGDDDPATFDSGWVEPSVHFPDIDVRISLYGEMYYDTVIDVRALSFPSAAPAPAS